MDIQEAINEVWQLACEHEGVPTNSQFVAFSPSNPHLPRLNRLTAMLHTAVRYATN